MKSLKSRLIALVSAAIVLTAIICGGVAYVQLKSLLLEGLHAEAKGRVQGYAQTVAEWLGTRMRQTAALRPVALVEEVVPWLQVAAEARNVRTVALGGGCFHNRLLSAALLEHLAAAGLAVLRPERLPPGDAGIAAGQAWVAQRVLQQGN